MFGMNARSCTMCSGTCYRDASAGKGLPSGLRTDQVFANLPAYAFPVARRFYRDYLGLEPMVLRRE